MYENDFEQFVKRKSIAPRKKQTIVLLDEQLQPVQSSQVNSFEPQLTPAPPRMMPRSLSPPALPRLHETDVVQFVVPTYPSPQGQQRSLSPPAPPRMMPRSLSPPAPPRMIPRSLSPPALPRLHETDVIQFRLPTYPSPQRSLSPSAQPRIPNAPTTLRSVDLMPRTRTPLSVSSYKTPEFSYSPQSPQSSLSFYRSSPSSVYQSPLPIAAVSEEAGKCICKLQNGHSCGRQTKNGTYYCGYHKNGCSTGYTDYARRLGLDQYAIQERNATRLANVENGASVPMAVANVTNVENGSSTSDPMVAVESVIMVFDNKCKCRNDKGVICGRPIKNGTEFCGLHRNGCKYTGKKSKNKGKRSHKK
jgi:hypothetical protein